jgi:hypothetical protein
MRLVSIAAVCSLIIPVPGVTQQPAQWRLSARPQLSIGQVEGDEKYMFTYINGAQRLGDGRIVVVERQQIRLYDQTGKFVKAIGRQGQGPGEYRFARNTFIYRGDSLAVHDMSLKRINIYTPTGEFGRSFQYTLIRGRSGTSIPSQSCCDMVGVLVDGSFIMELPEMISTEPGPPRMGIATLVRLSSDGAQVDTLGDFPGSRFGFDTNRPNKIERFQFSTWPSYAVFADRIYAGNGDGYVIEVVDRSGEKLTPIRSSRPRVRVTDAMKEKHKGDFREYARKNPNQIEGSVESYLDVPYPEFLPSYHSLWADTQGNVWAADFTPAPVGTLPNYVFTVFHPTGRELARVTLPRNFRPMHIGADFVLGSYRDEFEVEYVHMYDLIKR